MQKRKGHSKQRVKSRCNQVGFFNLPHHTCQKGLPTPEPHLGQAHLVYSGLGGTEGSHDVQVHEAAVTEALRVVGALDPFPCGDNPGLPALWLGWGQSSWHCQGPRGAGSRAMRWSPPGSTPAAPPSTQRSGKAGVSNCLSASPFLGCPLYESQSAICAGVSQIILWGSWEEGTAGKDREKEESLF